jgi:cytoskeletal protein CcmA (bactofilin family)
MLGKNKQPPIKSLIARGTLIEGHVGFDEGMRIDGEVVGDVRARNDNASLLVVSETATVTGQVHAAHVIINGTVRGPVHARQLLELQPKARIEGDVIYTALEMHLGALITGQLRPIVGEVEDKPTLKLAANNG